MLKRVEGVAIVEKTKYMGLTFSCKIQTILKKAEKAVKKAY